MALKLIMKKMDVKVWTESKPLRIGANGGVSWTCEEPLRSIKHGFAWAAETNNSMYFLTHRFMRSFASHAQTVQYPCTFHCLTQALQTNVKLTPEDTRRSTTMQAFHKHKHTFTTREKETSGKRSPAHVCNILTYCAFQGSATAESVNWLGAEFDHKNVGILCTTEHRQKRRVFPSLYLSFFLCSE